MATVSLLLKDQTFELFLKVFFFFSKIKGLFSSFSPSLFTAPFNPVAAKEVLSQGYV